MNIFKKIFSLADDANSVIGLCKFNDDFFKIDTQREEKGKKKRKKEQNLTQMLKRSV